MAIFRYQGKNNALIVLIGNLIVITAVDKVEIMATLSAKQQSDRAYYARNAERIRAKKRKQYREANATKPKNNKPGKEQQLVINDRPGSKENPVHRYPVRKPDQKKLQARRRIEDIKLARELDIDEF